MWSRKLRTVLLCALSVFVVSFLARTANWRFAFREGQPQFVPFDSLYHARRIVYSAQHPGRALEFDERRGTAGAFCPWPPLYDVAAGAAARLLGASAPRDVLARATFFPALFVSLFAALAAVIIAWRASWLAGLLAGGGIALALPLIAASELGSIDHHFLEPAFVMAILFAVVALRRARSTAHLRRAGFLLAGAVTAAVFVQPALLLGAGVALATILLFFERDDARSRYVAAPAFAAAALAVLFYRATRPPGYPDSAWYLGLPHAAALLAAAVAAGVAAWALSRGAPKWPAIGLGILAGAMAGAAIPGAAAGWAEGSGFFGEDPWLRTVSEFGPLFLGRETPTTADLALLGGGAILLVPFAADAWRSRRAGHRVLALFASAYFLAAVSSARFLVTAGPLLAVCGALLVGDLWSSGRRGLAAAVGALLLGPTLVVTLPELARGARQFPPSAAPLLRAANAIRGQSGPRARVLAPWSWGHLFDVAGGHFVLVDGFGTFPSRPAFEAALALPLMTREALLADACRASGICFIVLENPVQYLPPQAEAIGLARGFFERPLPGGRAAPTTLARASFWWRAYYSSAERLGPFRRVYADPQPAPVPAPLGGPAAQVWELVE